MNNQPAKSNQYQLEDLVAILQEDYQRFPQDQTFEIYAEDVYFKDPLNEFQGVKRYKKMIAFLSNFFSDIEMEVKDISQDASQDKHVIKTKWTLNMTSPLPWKPRLSIPGWSELTVNSENMISSHIDYWDISPRNVLGQNFSFN